jgi:hypothetical protein
MTYSLIAVNALITQPFKAHSAEDDISFFCIFYSGYGVPTSQYTQYIEQLEMKISRNSKKKRSFRTIMLQDELNNAQSFASSTRKFEQALINNGWNVNNSNHRLLLLGHSRGAAIISFFISSKLIGLSLVK